MGKGRGWHGDTAGHRRAALKGLYKSGRRRSMFVEAEGKYAGIVRFDSVTNAEKSIRQLFAEFNKAKTRAKRVRILKVANLAANRSEASAKKRDLKPETERRMRTISDMYRDAPGIMSKKLKK